MKNRSEYKDYWLGTLCKLLTILITINVILTTINSVIGYFETKQVINEPTQVEQYIQDQQQKQNKQEEQRQKDIYESNEYKGKNYLN